MNRAADYISADHAAELEDRAAELVERDHLHNLERDDLAAQRAEQHAEDCAVLEARAAEWCAVKDRSGWLSDYGWDSYWGDAL